MKKFFSVFLVVCLFAIIFTGCAKSESPTSPSTTPAGSDSTVETIKFAVVAPITGTMAQYGEALRDGYQLAVDQINAKGGIQVGDKASSQSV